MAADREFHENHEANEDIVAERLTKAGLQTFTALEPDDYRALVRSLRNQHGDDVVFIRTMIDTLNTLRAPREENNMLRDATNRRNEPELRLPPDELLAIPMFASQLARHLELSSQVIGEPVSLASDEHPQCVAISITDPHDRTVRLRSGTLIAPRVVLTAAHGIADTNATVMFGVDINAPVNRVRGRLIRHPEFEPLSRLNDIAVAVLSRPVEFVRPAQRAGTADIDAAADFRIVGFGAAYTGGMVGTKRLAPLSIASPPNTLENRFIFHRDTEILGSPLPFKTDTCKGDSGGPCYAHVGRQWLLAAVTSRGLSDQDDCGGGGIYVRVDRYAAWIDEMIAATS